MHPPSRGMAFLLSVGSLPIACFKDEGASDKSTGTQGASEGTTGGTHTTTGMTGSTTATPTTGGSASASETGTTGTPSTGDSQGFITTASSSGTTGDTGGLPPVTDPTCIAFAAKAAECLPRDDPQGFGGYCEVYKTYGLKLDGQACADAIDALFVCLSELSCDEFNTPEACATENAAAMQECPNLFEPGGSTSGSSTGP